MPRKAKPPDIPQGRQQLLKELATLRARIHSLEDSLDTTSAPISSPDPSTPHPQAYPLGDPAFPYQRMVEELSEGLVALSPTYAIRYVNRRFATLLDLSPKRLLDLVFFDLIALEDRTSFEEFLNGSPDQHVELRLIGADQRRLPVEISTRDWVVNGIRTFLVVMDITERQRVQETIAQNAAERRNIEKSLRDSERYFERIFRLSPTAILLARLDDGCILDVNDKFLRLTGYSREQVVGKSALDLGLWLDNEEKAGLKARLKDGKPVHLYEGRLRTQHGEVRDVLISADLIGRRGEDVILALIEDITERKRIEERARRHAEQMRQYAADMQRYVQDAQRHAAERQQRATLLERRVRGRTAELEAANQQLKEEIAAHQSEILARERTEAKLREVLQSLEDTMLSFRESEELLRVAIEAAGMVAWTYDPAKDKVVTFACTPGWLQILAEDRFPLFGRGLELIHPDDRDEVTEALPRVMTGQSFNIAIRLLVPDGGVRWIATQGRMMAGTSGKPPLLVGVTQDITKSRQIEQDLHQLNYALQELTQELESFSYSVSRDLRAPLSFIDVLTTTLQEDHGAQLPDEAQRYLALIRSNTEQMEALITSLLELSRLSRHALKREQVNMTALVQEVLETLQKEIQRPDLTIEVQDLPAAAADPVLIRQVWVNLIANAVKFTRKRERARIEIGSGRSDSEESVYFVRDNGVGFDMQQADRLFGVFQRLHAEEDYEGTGVGLAIVQRIIHRHGGRVWAEGRVGEGATFYFTLG